MNEHEPRIKKDWKKLLSPEVYEITRLGGTERAFSGKYYKEEKPGTYYCSNCQASLFHSGSKYDSGSGWPSFFEPLNGENIRELDDYSHNMQRTEVRCALCDAHLGHVFSDGPEPSGLRYCINSLSIQFEGDKF